MQVVDKAMPCVVRPSAGGAELLVIRHPRAGIQIPKGTVEPGEDVETAALRELEEETGVRTAKLVRALGCCERIAGAGTDETGPLEHHRWHVFRVELTGPVADRWTHRVTAPGDEQGMDFGCHWLPLAPDSAQLLHPAFVPAFELILRDAGA